MHCVHANRARSGVPCSRHVDGHQTGHELPERNDNCWRALNAHVTSLSRCSQVVRANLPVYGAMLRPLAWRMRT